MTGKEFEIRTQIFLLRARLKAIEVYARHNTPMQCQEATCLQIERTLVCAGIEALRSLLARMSEIGSALTEGDWGALEANL